MPEVLGWQKASDQSQLIHRAVQALNEGQLVVFPTETVYGIAASALVPEAVERLVLGKGRSDAKPFSLAIRSSQEVLDWLPLLSPLGKRLARRCWPGPVTM